MTPLYVQLMDTVEKDIKSGRYKPGDKIMTESDISDVRYSFSLEDAIVQLVDFDDNKLFPYIRKLIDTLEDILEPSPMI